MEKLAKIRADFKWGLFDDPEYKKKLREKSNIPIWDDIKNVYVGLDGDLWFNFKGRLYEFEEWCEKAEITEEQRVYMKLKYGI